MNKAGLCLCIFAYLHGISSAAAKEESAAPVMAQLAVAVALPFEKILPGVVTDYEILTASGDKKKEYLLEIRRLPMTGFRFVQDKGRSGVMLKPWLSIRNTHTQWGITVLLAYSGNWIMEIQRRRGQTVLRVDTSPSGLKPFAEFGGMPVPGALTSEFTGHWDNGAQPIVRFIRSKLLRGLGPGFPPVQFNTWYGSRDKFTEKELLDAARAAAGLGCELFTVDAGWYGVGEKWKRSLGNWDVNPRPLPNGLEPISDEVRRLGMKFGLWIEIECAAPDSPVLKQHPGWILKDGGKQASARTALDLGNPEVLAWAKSVIDRLVTTYGLDYIKMDFNTNLAVDGEQHTSETDPLYRHYRGLVELWKHMRASYPNLIVENCSSGSKRQDAMTAALTDTHWISDNVNNAANLAMNFGATYLFPPEICSHWTAFPGGKEGPLDLEASFSVSMLGHMGLSGKITEWPAETLKVARERIAFYKSIRGRLRGSDVFHLTPQSNLQAPGSMQAVLYGRPETGEAILFAFQGGDPSMEHAIALRGLKSDSSYLLRMPPGYGKDRTMSGKELVEYGFRLRFPRTGASAVILIDPN
ncbi:glycoside hydrolase family 36 protein [Candidatus Hydrogenedentota bacterium]